MEFKFLNIRLAVWQCSWLLGIALLLGLLPYAEPGLSFTQVPPPIASVVNLRSQRIQPPPVVLKELAQADVVYLGETHDRPEDHKAQLEIIQALHRLRPDLVIGMEMFQRPYQSLLDRYLAGELTESELHDRSEYQKRWGQPWEFYAPILRVARQNGLPVLALNTPTEITRKVARQGLDNLALVDRRFVPPQSAIVLGPDSYRQRLQRIFADIHQGKSSSGSFDRFFQAQVLWDETMAERIAYAVQRHPNALVVVLVGQGHLLYGEGIPSRVARRVQQFHPRSQSFSQVSILLNPPEDLRSPSARVVADYFWDSTPNPRLDE